MSEPVRLDAASVEAIARRTVDLLRDDDPDRPGPLLLTVAETARRLGMSHDWVREHRAELGVQTFGDGDRPRLMFPREGIESLARAKPRETSPAASTPPRLRPAEAELLPVRGGTR